MQIFSVISLILITLTGLTKLLLKTFQFKLGIYIRIKNNLFSWLARLSGQSHNKRYVYIPSFSNHHLMVSKHHLMVSRSLQKRIRSPQKRISKNTWIILDLSLFFIALLLIITFFGFKFPNLGKSQQVLAQDAWCVVKNYNQEYVPFNDLDRCCLQARQKLDCSREDILLGKLQLDWNCHTPDDPIEYHLNLEAYTYCKRLEFW